MTARKRALVRFMDGLDFEPGLAEIVNVRSYADTGIGTGGDTLPSGLDKLTQRPQVAALDLGAPGAVPALDMNNCSLCHRRPPS